VPAAQERSRTLFVYGRLAGVPVLQGVQQADLQELQGKWQVVAAEEDGTKDEGGKHVVITIRGTQWLADNGDYMTIAVNPLAEPKQLDFCSTEWGSGEKRVVTCPAIYALNGDTLTVCHKPDGDVTGVRPGEFSGGEATCS
jgi:uncharacterized protein (TIGR03067 family)